MADHVVAETTVGEIIAIIETIAMMIATIETIEAMTVIIEIKIAMIRIIIRAIRLKDLPRVVVDRITVEDGLMGTADVDGKGQ